MVQAALVAALACAPVSLAAAPGLWFWGSASPQSLADIAKFKAELGAATPTIYYSISGFSCAGGNFTGAMNSTLVKEMTSMGIQVHATVGSSSITDLRNIFANPTTFIKDAVRGLTSAGCAGINLDWEPYAKGMTKWTPGDGDGVLNKDGLEYAEFLDRFGKALHAANLELSLDFFSNLAIWNLPAMNASAVDTFIDMDTCASVLTSS